MAFVRKGELAEAEEEVQALYQMTKDSSLFDIILFSGNSIGQMASVAHNLVAAELSAAQGETEKADKHFQAAIDFEDDLRYAEPPAWHQPCRLNYGQYLLDQERYDDAVNVFNEELQVMRHDGWALKGLVKAYKGLGDKSQASDAKKRFEEAWKYADVEIDGPVM
jgi:predicted Zn-dependent protease